VLFFCRTRCCSGVSSHRFGRVAQGDVVTYEDPFHGLGQVLVGWAASEVPHKRAFSDGLPPNRAGPFPSTRLSSTSSRDARSCRATRVDGDVAIVAGDQGLPMACGHLLDPSRNRFPRMLVEILQVAHVMDLHAVM